MSAKITLLLIFCLIFSGSNFTQLKAENVPGSKQILTRSLIFPGWGQFSQKRYLPAVSFALSSATLITLAIIANISGNHYYRSYQNATDRESAIYYRRLTENSDRRRNILLLTLGVVWSLNLIDVYLGEKNRLKIRANLNDEKVALALYYLL